MKTIMKFLIYMFLLICSCKPASSLKNLLVGEGKSYWNYMNYPDSTKFYESKNAKKGVCFLPDGTCFEYYEIDNKRYPTNYRLTDGSNFEIKDVIMNWKIERDTILTIGKWCYFADLKSNKSILIKSKEEQSISFMLTRASNDLILDWSGANELIPDQYVK